MNPNYYSIVPATVRYSPKLNSLQKLLYSEITALSNKEGYCWATNDYFADLYGKSRLTISLSIKKLKNEGFIAVKVSKNKNGTERKLYINEGGAIKKLNTGAIKKLYTNNTSINNTSIVEANKEPLPKPVAEVHNTVQDSSSLSVRSTTQVKDKRKRAVEVTKLIQACQVKLGIPKLDGTQKETRNFASMLLSDLEKAKVPIPRFLEALGRIKHVQTAPYLRTSITSMYKIRQNLSKILKYGEDFSQQGWEVGVEYYQDGKILMCSPTGKLEVIEDIYKIKERKETANEDF